MAAETDVEAGDKPKSMFPIITSLKRGFMGRSPGQSSEGGAITYSRTGSTNVGEMSVTRRDMHPSPRALSRMVSGRMASAKSQGGFVGGLLTGNALAPGEAGDIVSAVKQLRRASMVQYHTPDNNGTPGLGSKTGSLCSYFYAPNPVSGRGASFSPTGELLLRYGYGPDIKILRTKDGSVAATLSHMLGHIRFATFSQDGALLCAASDDCRLLVWDIDEVVHTGLSAEHCIANINVGAEPLAYCQISPKGTHVLSCDDDGQLELWNIEQESMEHRFEINHAAKRCSFNEDGTMVISCSDYDVQVTLLDTETGNFLATETFEGLEEYRNKSTYVISADGCHVLVYIAEQCFNSNCAVYNTKTQSYHKLLACSGAIVHAEFSADGSDFVVAGRDDKIHVFDSATGSGIVTLEGHSSDVMFCRVSADRRLAISGDNGGHVFVWDVDSGACQVRLQGHNQPVVMCDINRSNSRALSLDTEGHAYMWNLDMQSMYDVMRQSSDQLCAAQCMPSGSEMVVGYADGTVKMWRTDGDIFQRWTHTHHEGSPLECFAVKRDGKLIASGSRDGRVVIVDARKGDLIARLDAHTDSITALHFSFNGSVLGSSSRDGTLRVWPTEYASSNVALHVIRVPNNSEILTCAISVNSKVAALGCACGTAYLYSLASSRQLHAMQVTDLAVQAVEFCSNGKYLAVGCADGVTVVVDVDSGQSVRRLVGNAQGVIANYFPPMGTKTSITDVHVLSICSRQAITWAMSDTSKVAVADFVADAEGVFHNRTMANRYFVGHHCLALFDPTLNAAMYDMRLYDKHPGDSYLFRNGTQLLMGGSEQLPMVMYAPPNTTVHMLLNEAGGTRSLDFSSDGHLLVSGNLRGELVVWDVEHRRQVHRWAAHKRSAVTCVKFSHDSASIYSCGEDCKVILWNWRTQSPLSTLSGHQAPVTSVDMSLDGLVMASGDKDGMLIVWETETLQPRQIVAAHEGAVLCCSLSPDGTKVASSGSDEHVVILDSRTGQELMVLDSALDGKGLTIKFSFDGTRVQIGGEKGGVLVWDVERNCLLYDITAHVGKVYDCSWSGDSRRLLSVGSDGRARLWDSAAGSEICAANLERGFGSVEAGGFIKCDLSTDGSNMAGCTARGQLVLWSVSSELRKGPEGSMLYQWLASMPVSRAKEIYQQLLVRFPLLMNAQDSRGWTVLMHAAHDSNPEITRLIVSNVRQRSGALGLTASLACRGLSAVEVKQALVSGSGLSVHHNKSLFGGMLVTRRNGAAAGDVGRVSGRMQSMSGEDRASRKSSMRSSGRLSKNTHALSSNASMKGNPFGSVRMLDPTEDRRTASAPATPEPPRTSWFGRLLSNNRIAPDFVEEGEGQEGLHQMRDLDEPNAIRIALEANSADCVGHLMEAVLSEKVTPGSYHAITNAMRDVAERYPAMCEAFMNGLPLMILGDVEVPSSMASQEAIVRAANSYTSYKEMWAEALDLDKTERGVPMVVMEAAMVRLPFAAASGTDSLLRTIVEADVPVETYGSETLKAIIAFKWQEFARKQIYTKSLVYLTFTIMFTAFAIVFADDDPANSFQDLLQYQQGRATVALCIILFLFGSYYMLMEMYQLYTIGVKAYFDSFWNFIDILSYAATLVIMPCVMARYGLGQGRVVPALVAVEVILLWVKQMFFALAVDGLGTFIYMTIEIIKGMRYFLLLLLMLFISFGTSFMVLFRGPGLLPFKGQPAPPPPPAASLPAQPPGTPPLPGLSLTDDQPSVAPGALLLFDHYADIGSAILSAFLTIFGNGTEDPRNGLDSDWPELATILLCLYQFTLIVVLINMLITLMADVYNKVVQKEKHVFLQGRAELIIEVETTMKQEAVSGGAPPYLHLLRPVAKASRQDDHVTKLEQVIASIVDPGAATAGETADQEPEADGSDGPGGNGGRESGTGLNRRLSFVATMRRETNSAFAGFPGGGATMARRKTMVRKHSYLGEDQPPSPSGGGGIEADAVMREVLGLKRMVEGLTKQIKIMEANQQHMMAISKTPLDKTSLDASIKRHPPLRLESLGAGSADGTGRGGESLPMSNFALPRGVHAQFSVSAASQADHPRVSGSGSIAPAGSSGSGGLGGIWGAIQSPSGRNVSGLRPKQLNASTGIASLASDNRTLSVTAPTSESDPTVLKSASSANKGVLKRKLVTPKASHSGPIAAKGHVSHISFVAEDEAEDQGVMRSARSETGGAAKGPESPTRQARSASAVTIRQMPGLADKEDDVAADTLPGNLPP